MANKQIELLDMTPYHLRMWWSFLSDNNLTPQILVATDVEGVAGIPAGYIQNGTIVLKVATRSVQALDMGNDVWSFRTRFNGADTALTIPVKAIRAIYAAEILIGEEFLPDYSLGTHQHTAGAEGDVTTGPDGDPPPTKPRGNHLRLVK